MGCNHLIDQQKLERLAEVGIKIGLGLAKGQDLLITAPLEAFPLVRFLTKIAYQEGAGIVTSFFTDDESNLMRFKYGHDEIFDKSPNWFFDGIAKAFSENTARLAITGNDPFLLADQDPNKVARVGKAQAEAYKPALQYISNFDINWTILSYPTKGWAKRVFPDLPVDEAIVKLSEALFAASRVNNDNAVESWRSHNAELHRRCDWLNDKNFSSLQFKGPGTNLKLGLAQGHAWRGGASQARNGVICNPNIPTEEVFTTPDAFRVDGIVSSTKPLSHNGTLIDDICVRFEAGRIVEAKSSKGESLLKRLLDTDEGASRLGEVALVPHSSPISQSGILYYNTLYDENASSHIALGQCYAECFKDKGIDISKEELLKRGGNQSLIHVDWMIGSDKIDVDGIKSDGDIIPVMRQGEWAY
ncbi:aminopeptidase [Bartonella sp. DGB1]|uniref:aminopeptidase n=1 Tax=Bartonella sp. DGB1 TaxID=3239807 RepID=UPI0035264992